MIQRDAQPIAHVSPYKRIDLMHPGRKAVITALDIANNGGLHPDPAAYRYDPTRDCWILKDGA